MEVDFASSTIGCAGSSLLLMLVLQRSMSDVLAFYSNDQRRINSAGPNLTTADS